MENWRKQKLLQSWGKNAEILREKKLKTFLYFFFMICRNLNSLLCLTHIFTSRVKNSTWNYFFFWDFFSSFFTLFISKMTTMKLSGATVFSLTERGKVLPWGEKENFKLLKNLFFDTKLWKINEETESWGIVCEDLVWESNQQSLFNFHRPEW